MKQERYLIKRETPNGFKSAENADRWAALVVVDTERDRIVARGRMVQCWDRANALNTAERQGRLAALQRRWTDHAFWTARQAELSEHRPAAGEYVDEFLQELIDDV